MKLLPNIFPAMLKKKYIYTYPASMHLKGKRQDDSLDLRSSGATIYNGTLILSCIANSYFLSLIDIDNIIGLTSATYQFKITSKNVQIDAI